MKTYSDVIRVALAITLLSIFFGLVREPYQSVAIPISNLFSGVLAPLSDTTQASLPPAPDLLKKSTFISLHSPREDSQVYGLVKMEVDTDGLASNPFDSAQIDIQVVFTSPQGTLFTVPAFWYQDFDTATLEPKGKPGWQVRFTPDTAGTWTAQAKISAAGLTSQPINIQVAASPAAHGFVRINDLNPLYLAFDDGSQYFPVGMNIAWATSLDSTLLDYNHWFKELSQNGGNFARVWMASWGLGIEWKDTGLGDYTNRLKQAWLLDQVFQMAGERGIYIMLSLINYGAFSQTADSEWSQNPYNARLGGPLQNPADFVTNLLAKELFKRRLRYIAARYGYSTNLMAWEWWNEVDLTGISEYRLRPWVAEMDQYLKTVDPYRHLTTISYSISNKNRGKMPELSFVQWHDYSGSDPINIFGSAYKQLTKSAPNKPVLMGELGSSADREDTLMDADPIQMHNGLWAAPFTGFFGTGMYWWWDNYVDSFDLWTQFKGISEFLKGENLALLKPGETQIFPTKAQTLTLSNSDRKLIWIRSNAYNYNSAQKAYAQLGRAGLSMSSWQYEPPSLSGLTVKVSGMADGEYTASWFDPDQAKWLADIVITVKSSQAVITVPTFSCDVAVKIVKK